MTKVTPIECCDHDFNMYYCETILIYNNEPYACGGVVMDEDSEPEDCYDIVLEGVGYVDPSDTQVKYLPPMYNRDGRWVGSHTGRSYKRAPLLRDWLIDDYKERLLDVPPYEFNGKKGRIGFEFFVADDAIPNMVVIFHRGCTVGFFEDGTFYVRGREVVERLQDTLRLLGVCYAIQSI